MTFSFRSLLAALVPPDPQPYPQTQSPKTRSPRPYRQTSACSRCTVAATEGDRAGSRHARSLPPRHFRLAMQPPLPTKHCRRPRLRPIRRPLAPST